MPSVTALGINNRYWISAIWVEAEPTARGVRSLPHRSYFHRYKVRFDWVENQGGPWWDTLGEEISVDKHPEKSIEPISSISSSRSREGPMPGERTLTSPEVVSCSKSIEPPL